MLKSAVAATAALVLISVPVGAQDVPKPAGAEGGGPVSSLEELQDAVVFITASGNFVDEQGEYEEYSTGSGFTISPDGLIATANHVVAGASTIEVEFGGDSAPVNAVLLGQSECADLALLGVDRDDLPYLAWRDAPPSVGLPVYAFGFPDGDRRFFRTGGTVARDPGPSVTPWSSIEQEIWHDAVTAPGASGGPLVDESAAVVGMHYAGDEFNRSYAIAADEASRVLERIRDGSGFSTSTLGINGEATHGDDQNGVFVYSVTPGSAADRAGIEAGDVITKLNGRALSQDGTMDMYCEILASSARGSVIPVEVRRPNGRVDAGEINGTPLPLALDADVQARPSSDTASTPVAGPQARVLESIPKAIAKDANCRKTRAADTARKAIASITCNPTGRVDKVWYELFATAKQANAYYESVRRGEGIARNGGGNCTSRPGEVAWGLDGDKGGRLVCFADGPNVWFVWKDNQMNMVATAARSDGNFKAMTKWWESAGPIDPDV